MWEELLWQESWDHKYSFSKILFAIAGQGEKNQERTFSLSYIFNQIMKMFWFRIKQTMPSVLAGFVVFTLRDQTEIVVAVEGKALHAYQTRSPYGLIGNKDGFV